MFDILLVLRNISLKIYIPPDSTALCFVLSANYFTGIDKYFLFNITYTKIHRWGNTFLENSIVCLGDIRIFCCLSISLSNFYKSLYVYKVTSYLISVLLYFSGHKKSTLLIFRIIEYFLTFLFFLLQHLHVVRLSLHFITVFFFGLSWD